MESLNRGLKDVKHLKRNSRDPWFERCIATWCMVEMKDRQYQRTLSRSYWSFFNETLFDVFVTLDPVSKLPNDSFDVFKDLIVHVNTTPPRTPFTVVWNKHLPHYDSTRDNQQFKEFTCLPADLPFKYGSVRLAHILSVMAWTGHDARFQCRRIGTLRDYRGVQRRVGMAKSGRNMVPPDYTDRLPTAYPPP